MQGRLVPWEPCVQGLQTQGDGHLPAVPQSDPSLSSLRGMQLEPAAFRGGGTMLTRRICGGAASEETSWAAAAASVTSTEEISVT